jgi:hypothetical protein
MSHLIPSTTLQRCNTSITHPIRPAPVAASAFRHGIAKDDPRRPTSAGLNVAEIASFGRVPHPATGDALVQRELGGEVAERDLVFLSAETASTVSRTVAGTVASISSANTSATNSRTTA